MKDLCCLSAIINYFTEPWQTISSLIYIDDKWTLGRTKQECEFWENEVKKLFSSAGWIFKPGKRSGDPAQVCRFLGLTIDSRDLTFNIPEDKIEKIERKASDLLGRKFNKVRKVASLVGLLQSVRRATGPIVSVFTRSLYTAIKAAARWESFIRLNEEAVFELRWWLENIRSVSNQWRRKIRFHENSGDSKQRFVQRKFCVSSG